MLYPSDEFGQQELPAAKIPAFVAKYLPLDDGSVQLMAKVKVNGERADPAWRWLKNSVEGAAGDVEWNFDSWFLVDQQGVAVGRYTASELERCDADLRYLLMEGAKG